MEKQCNGSTLNDLKYIIVLWFLNAPNTDGQINSQSEQTTVINT